MTIFWSMKMSSARRKPSPTALSVFIPVSLSNGGKLKIGPLCTLNTGTVKGKRFSENMRQNLEELYHICKVQRVFIKSTLFCW